MFLLTVWSHYLTKSEKEVMDILLISKRKSLNPWVADLREQTLFYTNEYNEFNAGRTRKKPRIPCALLVQFTIICFLIFHGEEHLPQNGDGSKVYNCKLKRVWISSISFPTDLAYTRLGLRNYHLILKALLILDLFIKKGENILVLLDLILIF